MFNVLKVSFKYHIILSLIIRFILIIYGDFHDRVSEVPYTDTDYKVFTDASRHVYNNDSPYNRHTYRYTPLLSILLLPNIFLNECFGKVLFSFIDIIVGLLIRILVKYSRKNYVLCKETTEQKNVLAIEEMNQPIKNIRKRNKNNKNVEYKKKLKKVEYDYIPDFCMYFWLYNPMSIIITTRGNCDSIAVFLVLLTLYLLQYKRNFLTAGLIHGLSIHFRLYPIMYSLSYFMFLSNFSHYNVDGKNTDFDENKQIVQQNKDISLIYEDKRRTIFKKIYLYYLIPNKQQLKLIFGTFLSLSFLTLLFYYLYGYKFLYETYIYHLIRKDTRHNFSLFFYLQYLTAGVKNIGIWQKVLCVLPQIILILVLSVRFGLNRFTLNFCVLTQTIVMVTYNSVLTSQYFIWIFGILPLVVWQIDMSIRKGLMWATIWFVAQLAWLLPAYLLEFQGDNTFLFIWLQGLSFFCANMAVLGRLVKCFMYKVE